MLELKFMAIVKIKREIMLAINHFYYSLDPYLIDLILAYQTP